MEPENAHVGVVGTGSFGLAISRLLAHNTDVLLYGRKPEIIAGINRTHVLRGVPLSERIIATDDLEKLAAKCQVIFPVVPSEFFRSMIRDLAPFLRPSHYMIHCTKGFDVNVSIEGPASPELTRGDVHTMSEVILDESNVLRVGCLSGPNLAREIIAGQPTATLVASEFTEVIEKGQELLSSAQFFVFGSHDLKGAEIAGAFKNVIAIGSGYLDGRNLGKNMQAMLITRGLHEMINFGKAMGAEPNSFMGTAGIGDLIATATSGDSRNFTTGKMMGQGKSLDLVLSEMDEVAEGLRTLKIAVALTNKYQITVPITQMIFKIIFEGFSFEKAMEQLMRYPYAKDVDFV